MEKKIEVGSEKSKRTNLARLEEEDEERESARAMKILGLMGIEILSRFFPGAIIYGWREFTILWTLAKMIFEVTVSPHLKLGRTPQGAGKKVCFINPQLKSKSIWRDHASAIRLYHESEKNICIFSHVQRDSIRNYVGLSVGWSVGLSHVCFFDIL